MKDLGINLQPRTVSRRTLRHLLSNPKTICLWRKFYYIGIGKESCKWPFGSSLNILSSNILDPGVPAVQTTQDSDGWNFNHLKTHFITFNIFIYVTTRWNWIFEIFSSVKYSQLDLDFWYWGLELDNNPYIVICLVISFVPYKLYEQLILIHLSGCQFLRALSGFALKQFLTMGPLSGVVRRHTQV